MRQLLALAAFVASALAAVAAGERIISGMTRGGDGDSFFVGAVEIRLNGVDAPEWNRPFGRQATAYRKELTGGLVDCDLLGEQTHGREVARCFVAGRDIGLAMIEAGWASAEPWFLRGRPWKASYEQAEREARRDGRGMWGGL